MNRCLYKGRMKELAGMLIRLCLFKSSKGSKLACKVSGFSYQLTSALSYWTYKNGKTKWNERVSGFALAGSSLFFKASKHVFKNSWNNCAYVFNCDELSGFSDSGSSLIRKYSSLPGGWLRWSKLLFLMSYWKIGRISVLFSFRKTVLRGKVPMYRLGNKI